MKKIKASKRFKIYKETKIEMVIHYPLAFPRKGVRPPLKVGILKDIINEGRHSVSTKNLRMFLSIWTRSTAYLDSVSRERNRVSINGIQLGTVSKLHALQARHEIKARRHKRTNNLTDNKQQST